MLKDQLRLEQFSVIAWYSAFTDTLPQQNELPGSSNVTYDDFNKFCDSLPATTHVIQWGGAHVWKVGGKVFAIGGWNKSSETAAFTFKTSGLNYDVLKEQDGFRPAPYLASRGMKWIQQFNTDSALDEQLKYYLSESYRMVSLGLTKKLQKELRLNQ